MSGDTEANKRVSASGILRSELHVGLGPKLERERSRFNKTPVKYKDHGQIYRDYIKHELCKKKVQAREQAVNKYTNSRQKYTRQILYSKVCSTQTTLKRA